MLMKTTVLISFALLLNCSANMYAQSHYKPVKKINVEGEGGWDLLTMDPTTNRLFLSHKNVGRRRKI